MNFFKVILVEDDYWVAKVNKEMIESIPEFAVVGQAENCAQAETLIETLKPDLVLLDIYLPDGRGLDLLKKLRNKNSATDFIMITSANDLSSVQEALNAGAMDYLIKPFQRGRLLQSFERYKEHLSLRRAATYFNQMAVDTLFGVQDKALPKGIEGQTLQKIRGLFKGSGRYTSDEVGTTVGMSRVTAWRYLEYLLENGEIAVFTEYKAVGRPTKYYQGK